MIHPLRHIREFLINMRRLLYWLPVIWYDRWWDDAFVLRILEMKLRYDADRYEKHGIAVGCERRARQMRIAAAICKRIRENNYNVFFSHQWVQDGSDSMFDCHMEGEWIGPFAGDNWIMYDDYMREQDLTYLCGILRKRLFSWWD